MQTAKAHAFPGTRRFEILAVLGEGGGGVVYDALDRERGARVALKTLRVADPERLLLLKKEFRAVQDLAHANLVTLHELFEEDGQWFFTMDLVSGVDFVSYVCPGARPPSAAPITTTASVAASRTRMRSAPPPGSAGGFDEERLRAALGQVVRGLSALHGVQKIHRDVKPSNVLVDGDGRVVILDFGVVSDLARDRTEGHGLVGTASYMAPEQAAGESIGPAADWYAVGTMLYEALTGALPFEGAVHEVLERKCVEEPPPPRAIAPHVPEYLDRLCADLLRVDPAARPDAGEILARLGLTADLESESRRGGGPVAMVGRRSELAALHRAFARTREGFAVTVLVHGESGVGKSFLVRSFADAIEADARATILRGRCYERESVPYKAIDGVVDDLTELLRDLSDEELAALLPPNVGLLCRAFPVLAQVPPIAEAQVAARDVENAQELRARVFRALRDLLANVARRRPLAIVIDDLQWADADSLALLAEVMRPPHEPPLLLLGTSRVGASPEASSRLEQAKALPGDVRSLPLEALSASDAHLLIARLLGGDDDAHAATIDAIAAEAKGHPLFIDELARARQQSLGGEGGAPLRLDDALWARVSRLSARSRALVELVAIAGVPLPQDTVARAMDLDFGAMFDVVATLRVGNLVRTAGAARTDAIEAYHDRIRESVLARVAPERRADGHRRLALALEHAARVDPELLSTQWHGAGDDARAAEYAIRAADQAFAALAFDQAATLYRRALDLGRPTGAERRGLQRRLAEALADAGRGGEAALLCLELAGEDASTEALDLRRRAAEQFLYTGHFERGVATLRGLLASLGERFPARPLTAILLVLFYRFLVRLRGLAFRPREAAASARELLVIDTLGSASAGFGLTDHFRGAYFNARAVHVALRARDAARLARALSVEAASCSAAGIPALAYASRMSSRALAIAPLAHQPFADAYAQASVGWVAYFTGQWRRAIDGLQRGEAIFRERCVGRAFEVNTVRAVLYRALLMAGALHELAASAGATMRSAEQRGDRFVATGLRATVFYFLALAGDRPERAREELARVEEHLGGQEFHAQHMHHLMAAGQVDLYCGDAEGALTRLARRWPTLRRSFMLRIQVSRIGFLDQRARCHLAIAASTGADRAAHLRAAVRDAGAIEREGADWGDALAALLRAQIAALRGDEVDAIRRLRASVDAFTRVDMPLHAAAARRRLGERLGGGDGETEVLSAGEGSALIGEADAWMYGRDVQRPAKLAALFAPGFARRRA